jgi:hypothetical protein
MSSLAGSAGLLVALIRVIPTWSLSHLLTIRPRIRGQMSPWFRHAMPLVSNRRVQLKKSWRTKVTLVDLKFAVHFDLLNDRILAELPGNQIDIYKAFIRSNFVHCLSSIARGRTNSVISGLENVTETVKWNECGFALFSWKYGLRSPGMVPVLLYLLSYGQH